MIDIKEKYNCVGCEACRVICPVNCISFIKDNEGFAYPVVDKALCINCSKCDKVCPVLNINESTLPAKSFSAKTENDRIREKSSSGAVFYSISEAVINKGGVVFAVKFDENHNLVYDSFDKLEDIEPYLGSKYVQAEIKDTFLRIKEFLKQDRCVLFVSSPCYASALNKFLKKEYEKLLIVDFVCHGVPSFKVWQKYSDAIIPRENLKNVNFRDKVIGWREFVISFTNRDGEKIYYKGGKDLYKKAFVSSLILRPSCYKCPAKKLSAKSDVTIGDLWCAEKILNRKDDNKGLSLLTVNSDKGRRIVESLKVKLEEVEYSKVLKFNANIVIPTLYHRNREKFFSDIDKTEILDNLRCNSNEKFYDRLRYKLYLKLYTIRRFLYLKRCK